VFLVSGCMFCIIMLHMGLKVESLSRESVSQTKLHGCRPGAEPFPTVPAEVGFCGAWRFGGASGTPGNPANCFHVPRFPKDACQDSGLHSGDPLACSASNFMLNGSWGLDRAPSLPRSHEQGTHAFLQEKSLLVQPSYSFPIATASLPSLELIISAHSEPRNVRFPPHEPSLGQWTLNWRSDTQRLLFQAFFYPRMTVLHPAAHP
jgi:hypothetical protein